MGTKVAAADIWRDCTRERILNLKEGSMRPCSLSSALEFDTEQSQEESIQGFVDRYTLQFSQSYYSQLLCCWFLSLKHMSIQDILNRITKRYDSEV
ncbi:hypothetical protein MPTK1_5g16870 [Marchantia polymorpha subsp. ruderalis]|uniref:Uncharacterized protein n=2 Tax=Marchantia polymorpha TaxID=3197 RepID=A0AAF6BJ40_MARPO|nr:hypothetical protein MARPO_0117s0019 [Marchantia polymorpha]PTQ30959.1 hypothetical protein MARPO_0117s0019 [Marchantia polymorpha]BBN12024.1 hypothetical protein Mp_5g16870 [Marchantia polymorpha subsp. ruderalis]BBN12025.1 hypothetical protein Mp_5g16870 [Marchantia polymorpha subsp. ruderalis]|eukprot:PTQ30958.1 hypothetical protein MARPO_0117s0019 [Marchantia polymorpha]